MQEKSSPGTLALEAAPAPLAAAAPAARRPFPWHVVVLLAPAVIVYTAVMILPLAETLRLSFFNRAAADAPAFFVKPEAEAFDGVFDDASILLLPGEPRILAFRSRDGRMPSVADLTVSQLAATWR